MTGTSRADGAAGSTGDPLDLLAGIAASTIGHFHRGGFMDPGFRALSTGGPVVGRALTVRSLGEDGAIVAHALGTAKLGDFLIVDRDGDMTFAAFGGVLAYAAKIAGVVGVVVDGLVCDPDELRETGLPVWARGTSALTTRRLARSGEAGGTVSCGGVLVVQGDIVVADESGVVILKPAEAEPVAKTARELQAREKVTRERLAGGETIAEIAGTATLFAEAKRAMTNGQREGERP